MRLILVSLLCLAALPTKVYSNDDDLLLESPEKRKAMMIQLKHVDPEEVVSILNELFDIKFSIHEQANTIYGRGTEEQIKEATLLIHNLDEATAAADNKRKENGQIEIEIDDNIRNETKVGGESRSFDRYDVERSLLPLITELARTASEFGSEHPKSKELSKRIASIRKSMTSLADQLGTDIAAIEGDLAPLVIEQAIAASEFGSEHPKVRRFQKQIEATHQALRESHAASRKGRNAIRASRKYSARHHELETEVSKLAAELRESSTKKLPEDELEQVKAGLTESVGKLFDIRQEAERADWEQASEQLSKIRKRLDERKNNRDAIIQKRVESLLDEKE